MENYDFSGWATRANLRCTDGRTIMKDAFKHHHNKTVPLIWMHQHTNPEAVLGHALLKNMDEGLYAYCSFNDTESGQMAKKLVQHGDVSALSIHATRLKQDAGYVSHGTITEVSLVLAGANPGAYIDDIMSHGDYDPEDAIIGIGEDIILVHADDEESSDEDNLTVEHDAVEEVKSESNPETETDTVAEIEHSEGEKKEEKPEMADTKETKKEPEKAANEKTVQDVLDTFNEEQKTVLYALIGQALEDAGVTDEDDEDEPENKNETVKHSDEFEGGNETMNVFENNNNQEIAVLSHADQELILKNAKAMGSFKAAVAAFVEDNKDSLAHGFDGENMGKLFPDAKDVYPGAPELVERDHSWVGAVLNKAHKSPAFRIRTRHADATAAEARAKGYVRDKNEGKKATAAGLKAITRTTDAQTVYYREDIHRDDILELDFDIIAYEKAIMKNGLEEEVARAALIGDGREDGHQDKIDPEKIRPVWGDAPEYTIQALVDTNAMKKTLQGTNTDAYFGEEFIFTEAVIASVQDAMVNYKGKGTPDFFCPNSTLNKMLRCRDMNGRRIYDSAADLAKALNVGAIHTMQQMEGQERTDVDTSKKFKLHGLLVNMANYTFGSSKGGEITGFEQFDIDYNNYKFLQEARTSGALSHLYSAIAVEEDVTVAG